MATIDSTGADSLPAEVLADNQAIIDHLTGRRPLAPEVARRVRERAERVTEAIRQQHGLVNLAVQLIREGRDEE